MYSHLYMTRARAALGGPSRGTVSWALWPIWGSKVLNRPSAQTPKRPNAQALKLPNVQAPKPPKRPIPQAPKPPNTKAPKYPSAQVHKRPSTYLNAQAPKLPNVQAPKHPKSQALVIDRTLALSETSRTELFGHCLSETSAKVRPNRTLGRSLLKG